MEMIELRFAMFLVLAACGASERPTVCEQPRATPLIVVADASRDEAPQVVSLTDASVVDASDASRVDPALVTAAHALVLQDVKVDPSAHGVVTFKSVRVSHNFLPAEVITRILRQNFGRFRLCLERDGRPSLRVIEVTTFFAIGQAGEVNLIETVSAPDEEFARCVRSGFSNLSYPQPDPPLVAVEVTLRLDADALPVRHGAAI